MTTALRGGAVLALHFVNFTLPLAATVEPRRVVLSLGPVDGPRPE